MSQSNEINFGPVFMRGRKPAPVTNKPNPISNNPPGSTQTLPSQPHKSIGGPTGAILKPNYQTPSAASSPAINTTSLPLPKSFSAAVSPSKEIETRPTSNGMPNASDTNPNHLIVSSTPHVSPACDYSRETLLNLYSEQLASQLPPDLEINDPAVSLEFVGPPLALIEMTEAEKELFSGPFNSEKRSAVNKANVNHLVPDHSLGLTLSPETSNHGLPNNKLSVGGTVKLGKHNSTDRFNSLGIHGGVLAGVAAPTHSNPRRRGDNELDPQDAQHRFQRSEDTMANAGPWGANLRDRRARDSGPAAEGKWKRGISFEDKIQSQETSGGSNLKYSVLDKMREKAAANLEIASKEAQQSASTATQIDHKPEGGDQLPAHVTDHSTIQPRGPEGEIITARKIDENVNPQSPIRHETSPPVNVPNSLESTTGSIPLTGSGSSTPQPPSNNLNPEDIAWQYRDPSGTVQGPFTAFQMQEWYKATFFREDLLVKRVIDAAFETLETLILRVGDRDRPFLARPPPALPPNLPLPHGHSYNHQLPTSQASPLPSANILDQASINVCCTESSSIVGSSLTPGSTSVSNQLGGTPSLDPWNNIAPGSSPLPRPGTVLSSKPLVSGTSCNSSLRAYGHLETTPNHDLECIDITPLNPAIIPNAPNPFVQLETIRYLQQIQHPVLSIAAANGYPFPLPLGQPPNFGQIPPIPPLANGSAMDPILAAQLHARLMHSPYLFNLPAASGIDGLDHHVERAAHNNFAPSENHVDPWQGSSQPLNDSSASVSDKNHVQPTFMTTNHNQPALPSNPDDHLPVPDQKNAQIKSQRTAAVNSQPDPAAFSAAETRAPAPSPSSKFASGTENQSSVSTTEQSVPSTYVPGESNLPDRLAKSSSLTMPSTQLASATGITTNTDLNNQSWQNVNYQPAAQLPNTTQAPGPSVSSPSAPKPTGKVVVVSRAQQDEQDRRTASIQKTQLQLKEAQAVERAAREASEAAAAAVSASFNTPAPWSKEEKPPTNMSLTEIQAIEAKQAEKRRLAEKQAAATRAMAAERASKAAKEALSPTSNWAATTSSPIKPSNPGTVWRPKESGGLTSANGPKQSMKQIQEEEARKKSLALQQATKSAASTVTKPAGGYAGTVASTKAPVGGPWSVVGAKSKVIAPPPSANSSAAPGNPPVASITTRVAAASGTANKPIPKTAVIISKTTNKPPQTAPATSAASNNSSTTAHIVNADGPPPASPEFMKWLREALRGMNNVEDFVKMLLDFPINPDESVLEIVSDSVYAGSATLDGRRFAKEFNARRMADVASRMNKGGSLSAAKNGDGSPTSNGITSTNHQAKKTSNFGGFSSATTMADAVKFQPSPKNDGWGFAVVSAKKKKK